MLLLKTTLTTENVFLLCFKYLLLLLYCSFASWGKIVCISHSLEILYLHSPLFVLTQEDFGKVKRSPFHFQILCKAVPSL